MIEYSTDQFHWNNESLKLSAEISELMYGRRGDVFGPIYDDACDEGFVLVSINTGTRIRFVVTNQVEREGEVLCWNLVPIPEDKHLLHPRRRDISIVIFND